MTKHALAIVGSAVLLVGAAVAASGEELPTRPTLSLGNPDDPRASLLVYDAAYCDEMIAGECPLVTFECSEPAVGYTEFLVTIEDIDDQDLARWLMQKQGLTLVVSGKEVSNSDNATAILKNDMNGTWGVSFRVNPSEIPLTAKELAFETISGTRTVPLTAQGRADLERLIAACR